MPSEAVVPARRAVFAFGSERGGVRRIELRKMGPESFDGGEEEDVRVEIDQGVYVFQEGLWGGNLRISFNVLVRYRNIEASDYRDYTISGCCCGNSL